MKGLTTSRFGGAISGRMAAMVAMGAMLLPGFAMAAPQTQPGPSQFADLAFRGVWERTDLPVYMGKAKRSWLWGAQPSVGKMEPMAESPGGMRQVQYFDKSRMEINDPRGANSSPWFVTNGLLVYEMLSGKLQVGFDRFEAHAPARILVAGESSSAARPVNFTPTYESMAKVATLAPGQNVAQSRLGQEVNETLAADGTVTSAVPQGLNTRPKLQYYEKMTGHNIPDVFWSFMSQKGMVYENGQYKDGQVFDWVYAMGYPLTEPYWIRATVNGKDTTVMVQAFQRRVLTYTPTNAPEWRVEMGNVGMQYYQWRYGELPPAGTPTPSNGGTALSIRPLQGAGITGTGSFSGIHKPLYTTALTPDEWDNLWSLHTADIDASIPAPKVDFKTEFVAAAFSGDKPNGCYRINIEAVSVQQSTITVRVGEDTKDGPCTDAISQPNSMVAVSRAGLSQRKYQVVFVSRDGGQLATKEITLR